jgi:hypothetical protein
MQLNAIILLLSLILLTYPATEVFASESVNLLGEWKYAYTMKNMGCDEKIAKGTITFNADGTDTAHLGVVRIVGDTFRSEAGKCSVVPFSTELAKFTGTPVQQTRQQYEQSKLNDWGRQFVKKTRIEAYTSSRIVEVIEYNNNMITTWIMTR